MLIVLLKPFVHVSVCHFSSVLPKHFAGPAGGFTTQTPGTAVHADGEDPCITGPARSVSACASVQKTHFYQHFSLRSTTDFTT